MRVAIRRRAIRSWTGGAHRTLLLLLLRLHQRRLTHLHQPHAFPRRYGTEAMMFEGMRLFAVTPCLGQTTCYTAAFGVPALLMLIAVGVFLIGSRWYKRVPVRENIFNEFFKVIFVCNCKCKLVNDGECRAPSETKCRLR